MTQYRCAGTLLCAVLVAGAGLFAEERSATHWVTAWGSTLEHTRAMEFTLAGTFTEGLVGRTIRSPLPVTIDGSSVRVRLTNMFGNRPITFEHASIAVQQTGAAVRRGSVRALSFSGRSEVTILEGADAWSDPVALAVKAGESIVVSLFSSTATGAPTGDFGSGSVNTSLTSYLAPGNTTGDEGDGSFVAKTRGVYFIHGVDVLTSSDVAGAIVAVGDSLTAGTSAWPSVLAQRLMSNPSGPRLSVLNAAIGGNRLLGNSSCFGIGVQARFANDALLQPGVRAIIVFIGINDILQPDIAETPSTGQPLRDCMAKNHVTAEAMIAGYKQLITRARAMDVKIYGVTLIPYKGQTSWTESGERTRAAINQWIRTSGAFDAVIDFESAIADKADPLKLSALAEARDSLHPGPGGHKILGASIPLRLFESLVR